MAREGPRAWSRVGRLGGHAATQAIAGFCQSEKADNGGPWRNLMDPVYDYIGIGVWRMGMIAISQVAPPRSGPGGRPLVHVS